MQQKSRERLERWLRERKTNCLALSRIKAEQGRQDEADFEKIRANIYGIFETVLGVSAQKEEREAVCFFAQKLDEIPRNWSAALEKAQVHGDWERERIESLKLETQREIRAQFEALWGGAD